jgi:hypothetical protein
MPAYFSVQSTIKDETQFQKYLPFILSTVRPFPASHCNRKAGTRSLAFQAC